MWIDALILGGFVAVVFGAAQVASEWKHPLNQSTPIDLGLSHVPEYALFSFVRGWLAYFVSLVFTLVVASWAYYDHRAHKFILPALDILQSIPVTAFLAPLFLVAMSLFPHSNTGLELACIMTIFTGQVWNMVFSYYDSLKAIPADFRMLAKLYNLNWWQRFWRVELPFGAQTLLYNSMVSMAGGWFFLSLSESPQIGSQTLRVPGIGSYFKEAVDKQNGTAQVMAIVAMGIIIIIMDRLIWWPLIVWSRKFKMDDFGGSRSPKNSLQLWLSRSAFVQATAGVWGRFTNWMIGPPLPVSEASSLVEVGAVPPAKSKVWRYVYLAAVLGIVALLAWGAYKLVLLLLPVTGKDWLEILGDTGISFLRVTAALAIGTLWTVPFGIWIGLNPKLSGRLQPFIQFVASFPAPMLYPWLFAIVLFVHGTLQWGAVLLILFGTQWYILFNVAAAAAAIPNDIISCAEILRLKGWRKWKQFLLPAILPGLVTGWITAAGGAWNTTIVAEYGVQAGNKLYNATGLGAYLGKAIEDYNFSRLTAAVLVMSVIVVGINRTVWKRIQAIANDRCRFIT
ncbi:MAG TPA: ABC transporter permease subunit [Opitutaceae bacterium]|nr:ABC transporter permease subunit [Opitutaceae bacterium]